MYATVTHYKLREPMTDQERSEVERGVIDPIATSAGFQAYYAVRVSDTEIVAITVWDSQKVAEQALEKVRPVTRRLIGHKFSRDPERSVGEVTHHRKR